MKYIALHIHVPCYCVPLAWWSSPSQVGEWWQCGLSSGAHTSQSELTHLARTCSRTAESDNTIKLYVTFIIHNTTLHILCRTTIIHNYIHYTMLYVMYIRICNTQSIHLQPPMYIRTYICSIQQMYRTVFNVSACHKYRSFTSEVDELYYIIMQSLSEQDMR